MILLNTGLEAENRMIKFLVFVLQESIQDHKFRFIKALREFQSKLNNNRLIRQFHLELELCSFYRFIGRFQFWIKCLDYFVNLSASSVSRTFGEMVLIGSSGSIHSIHSVRLNYKLPYAWLVLWEWMKSKTIPRVISCHRVYLRHHLCVRSHVIKSLKCMYFLQSRSIQVYEVWCL